MSRGKYLASLCIIKEGDCDKNLPANSEVLDKNDFSECDDSDADPDFDPKNLDNKKRKQFFNLDNLLSAENPRCEKKSSPVSKKVKIIEENITLIPENIDTICKNVLTDILNKICNLVPEISINKYALLPACNETCRKKCFSKLQESFRETIRNKFWRLSFGERRLFLDGHVQECGIKTRRQEAQTSNRSISLQYFLQRPVDSPQGFEKIQVCKTMFLHTLGLKTDGMITCHIKAKRQSLEGVAKTVDDRGLISRGILQNQKMETAELIVQHINSYNPAVSHYNLVHSPNRRYLPSELTITYLWNDFCEIKKISYDVYRKIFDQQNIGFKKPSQDECVLCLKYKTHIKDLQEDCQEKDCSICANFKNHKKSYTEARQSYEADSGKQRSNVEKIYAVDMQKVLLLPKMSTKQSFFIPRLVVFNETFASLHQEGNKCVMWHEAIRGRSASDVASAYYNLIKSSNIEVKEFIIWVDNCSAQNKNWTLYSSFVCFVNAEWGPNKITFIYKYFEPGHSFMAADSVHGCISNGMKKYSNIYDFEQLLQIIEKSSKKTKCLALNISDFFSFQDGSKQRKNNNIPRLETIKVVEFRKDSRCLFFKDAHFAEYFTEIDFLKQKFQVKFPEKPFLEPLGINTSKKEKILNTLLPSFQDERKKLFWQFLPANDNSVDLCQVSEK